MQCEDVELVLEQEGLAPLPEAARAHLAACSHCQGLLADLETIVSLAVELPDEVSPPERVWVSLRAQLEREGILGNTAAAEQSAPWWTRFSDLFGSRNLATVTVGLVIAMAGVLELAEPPKPPVPTSIADSGFGQTAKVLSDQEVDLQNMHLTGTSPVDASLQQNLVQLNEFIAECERHLQAAPQDELAREYLADAYQQKAELLAAMMDRGRSVN